MSPPLISKAAAHYTGAGGKEHCSLCRHFSPRRGGRCARVLGDISPRGWCRLFSREMRSLIPDASSFNGNAGGPALSLDFLTPGTLDPRLTFTRASTGTYFDSAGVMRSAAVNAPRWDYDPATLALRGLLLEDARTNPAVPSSDFTTGFWAKTDTTATAASGIAPDGTNTMQRIAETATNALHYLWQLHAVPASVMLTASVFVKMQQIRYLQFFLDNGASLGAFATFDLQAGTVSQALTAMGGATIGTASIVPISNGIYRCAITTTIGSSVSARFGLILSTVPTSPFASNSYLGNAANGTLFWGAQTEAGAFATSHIPTTSAAVTRAKDQAFLSKTGWYVPPGGSWFVEYIRTMPHPTVGLTRLVQENASVGTTPLFCGTVGDLGAFDGALLLTANAAASNTIARGASTWAPGTGKVCLNGGAVTTGAQATGYPDITLPFQLFQTAIVNESTTGYLRKLSYYARVLADSEMQALTAGDPPSLDLNFMVPGALDSRVSFSRASVGTYTDSTGTIQTAVVNQPRWDYDAATRALRGLLIEEARTNGIPNGNAVGAVVGGTLPTGWAESNNTGIAPAVTGFGTESGIPYVDIRFAGTTSSGTANNIYIANGTVPAGNSQAWTASVYLRLTAGTMPANSVSVLAASNIGPHYPPTVTPTGAPLVSQRYLNAFTTAASGVTSLSLIIGISMPPLTAVDFTLRIGAAQMEAGAFPTSYIATAGSAQTRAADVASIPTAGGWYNGTTGTVATENTLPANGNNGYRGVFTLGGGVNQWLRVYSLHGSADIGGNADIPTFSVGTMTPGATFRAAVTYTSGRVTMAMDGALKAAGAFGLSTSASYSTLWFGSADIPPGNFANGYIRRVQYWPRALADHELQAVTYNPGATLLPAPEPPTIDNELPTPPPARPDNELPETPTPRGRRNGR
jgi:hypothetical protein